DQNCPGEVYVKNHVACLPYGFASILAVEDERGRRLPEGGDITDLRSTTKLSGARPDDARISTFAVNPLQHQTSDGTPTTKPGTGIPYTGEDIIPLPISTST